MTYVKKKCYKDQYGWTPVEKEKPLSYQIVHLRKGHESRRFHGWWTGKNWSGLRIDPKEKFDFWKKMYGLKFTE